MCWLTRFDWVVSVQIALICYNPLWRPHRAKLIRPTPSTSSDDEALWIGGCPAILLMIPWSLLFMMMMVGDITCGTITLIPSPVQHLSWQFLWGLESFGFCHGMSPQSTGKPPCHLIEPPLKYIYLHITLSFSFLVSLQWLSRKQCSVLSVPVKLAAWASRGLVG